MNRLFIKIVFCYIFGMTPLLAQKMEGPVILRAGNCRIQDGLQRTQDDTVNLAIKSTLNMRTAIPFAGTVLLMQETEKNGTSFTKGSQPTPSLSQQAEPKSVGKAFLYSLLLPGAGQYYTESRNSAVLFLGAEALLWLGMVGNNLYADHLVDEYKTYAVQHAGVSAAGKDKDYWISIGKYDDIYSYNEQRRRERRFDEVYSENAYYYWSWDSKTNRYSYDRSRLQANEIADREVYFWGAIALNHLASAIHALAMARKYNKALQQEGMSWDFRLESRPPHNGNGYLGVAINARF
ncbi:MAG TPA: hypothetical protein EYP36_12775 [Calditrichaeota bacterium]|nr:hypothetical protein [Calditrichota bacterium]